MPETRALASNGQTAKGSIRARHRRIRSERAEQAPCRSRRDRIFIPGMTLFAEALPFQISQHQTEGYRPGSTLHGDNHKGRSG